MLKSLFRMKKQTKKSYSADSLPSMLWSELFQVFLKDPKSFLGANNISSLLHLHCLQTGEIPAWVLWELLGSSGHDSLFESQWLECQTTVWKIWVQMLTLVWKPSGWPGACHMLSLSSRSVMRIKWWIKDSVSCFGTDCGGRQAINKIYRWMRYLTKTENDAFK